MTPVNKNVNNSAMNQIEWSYYEIETNVKGYFVYYINKRN